MCRHILISLECPKTGEEWSATSPVVLRSLAPLQLAGPSREILPQKNPRLLQTRVSRAVMNSRLPATAAGDRKEPSRGRASSGDLRDQLPVPTRYFWDYHIELVHTGSCYLLPGDHRWTRRTETGTEQQNGLARFRRARGNRSAKECALAYVGSVCV